MSDSITVRFSTFRYGDGSVQLAYATEETVVLGKKFRNAVDLSRALRRAALPPYLALQTALSEEFEVCAAQLKIFNFRL